MRKYKNKNKLKFRIITSIIPNSETNLDVFQSLYAVKKFFNVKHIEAVPSYRNKKSDEGKYLLDGTDVKILSEDDYKLHNDLYMCDDRMNVNKINYVKTKPEGETSLLYPLPSFQSEPISRQIKSEPSDKHVWCTGSISEPYYKATVGGNYAKKLHNEHGLGGLLIEYQPNGTFRIHKLQYKNGSICLLKWKFGFKGGKHYVKNQKCKAVVLGDEHPDELDLKIFNNNQDFVNKMNSPFAFHHDWFNGTTISHHNERDIMLKNKIFRELGTLNDEIKLASDVWYKNQKKCSKTKHIYVASNHPDHLMQYLKNASRHDFVNYDVMIKLNSLLINSASENEFWHEIFGKFNKLCKKRNIFLSKEDLYKIGSFICSEHGHDGDSGARGSLRSLDKYLTVIIGHSHSPRQGRKGSIQVGTSTHLILNYTSRAGTSGWSNALAYVNENDTANLLIAIDGNYTIII